MTFGEIFATAYELKVFQIWQLSKELEKNWGFLGRSYIKERVRSWLKVQVRAGAVIKVSDDPVVFTFPEFKSNWQELIEKRTCPICSNPFIPSQDKQEFCSEQCKKQHYKQYHKERRTKAGMKTGTKRRWSKEEKSMLLNLKDEGYTYAEIAQKIGRTTTSVIEKYKELKGVRRWKQKQS